MSNVDRSKYIGGNRKAQKTQAAEVAKITGGKAGWHKIANGRNWFRIAPPHNPEHSAYQPYRTSTIETEKPVYENGEKTDKIEIGNRKLVSALLHHEQLKKLGVYGDPVELFCKMAKDMTAGMDKSERDKFLAPIFGWKDKEGFHWGIAPKTSYLCYSWDADGVFAKNELYDTWKTEMDAITERMEESEGEPLEIDPFSNIEEGFPLIITKSKTDKGKTEYIIEADQPSRVKRETYDDFFARTAITDEQLAELDKATPLYESYANGYSKDDYDAQIIGLKLLDDKYNFGIVDSDEFQEACSKILAILTNQGNTNIKQGKTTDAPAKVATEAPKVSKTTIKTAAPIEEPKKTTKAEVKQPVKVVEPAPVKKVIKKQAGPTTEEMVEVIGKYIEQFYGEEFLPQIPEGDAEELKSWYETVLNKEAGGDLPLVPADEFEQTNTEETEEEETEEEPEVDDDDDAEELRKQMEALRASRRK